MLSRASARIERKGKGNSSHFEKNKYMERPLHIIFENSNRVKYVVNNTREEAFPQGLRIILPVLNHEGSPKGSENKLKTRERSAGGLNWN